MGTVADKLNYLSGTKDQIKAAIVQKGVAVPEDTPFRQYARLIKRIPTNVPGETVEEYDGTITVV